MRSGSMGVFPAITCAASEGNSSGSYVDAEKKLVALLGVKDLIVVDTLDALLIADPERRTTRRVWRPAVHRYLKALIGSK